MSARREENSRSLNRWQQIAEFFLGQPISVAHRWSPLERHWFCTCGFEWNRESKEYVDGELMASLSAIVSRMEQRLPSFVGTIEICGVSRIRMAIYL